MQMKIVSFVLFFFLPHILSHHFHLRLCICVQWSCTLDLVKDVQMCREGRAQNCVSLILLQKAQQEALIKVK